MSCPSDIAPSAVYLRDLLWDTQGSGLTDPSPDTCPTAKSMKLTPLNVAMVQSRAAKLYPHNLLRRRRYVAAHLALGKVS